MNSALIIGVLANIVVIVLYAIFFGGREAEIRDALKERTTGAFNWFHERAIIGAIQGRASGYPSSILVIFTLLLTYLLAFGATEMEKTAQGWIDSVDALIFTETHEADATEELSLQEALLEAADIRADAERFRVFFRIASLILVYVVAPILLIWYQYVRVRNRAAFLLSRLREYLLPLLTPSEVESLARAEFSVNNRETLHTYLDNMESLAKKHDISLRWN